MGREGVAETASGLGSGVEIHYYINKTTYLPCAAFSMVLSKGTVGAILMFVLKLPLVPWAGETSKVETSLNP